MKIRMKYIGAQIAVIIFSLYAYSQLGLGSLLPSIIWQVLLVSGLLLFMKNSYKGSRKVNIDLFFVLSIVMLVISLAWNNQEILRYGFWIETYIILVFLFYWISYNNDRWHETLLKMMKLCGGFYTLFTYICVMFPAFYRVVVYPLFSFLEYDYDNKAGFTSNYGTNGLFMCTGLCAYVALIVFNPEHRIKRKDFALLLALIVGMLLSGKRGQTIAIVFAILVCYYFYNSNKKHGRVLKIVGILILTIIAIYILSLVFPEVLTIINRFEEEARKGDVSTGRFTMWASAVALFVQKPWTGYGWRYFKFTAFSLDSYDVHNVFLQLLVEVGVVGSIPFFIFIFGNLIKVIRLMVKVRRYKSNVYYTKYISAALIDEVFFIVMCASGTAYYQLEYLFTYLLCCSMVQFYTIKLKNDITTDQKDAIVLT